MDERFATLHARALCLLADCSWYVPRHLQNEIQQIAEDSGKAGMPLRVEHHAGSVIIIPLDTPE